MKAFLVTFGLLAVLITGLFGITSAAEQVPNTLLTEGFEVGEDKLPADWTIFSGETMYRSNKIAHGGKYSFYIDDQANTVSLGIRSPLKPIEAGKEYVASAWVWVSEGNAQVYLEFWDAAGTQRIEATAVTIQIPALEEWQEAVIQKVAPPNAKYVSVIVYANKTNVGNCYFDDVKISPVPSGS